jgi:hypothetical protein
MQLLLPEVNFCSGDCLTAGRKDHYRGEKTMDINQARRTHHTHSLIFALSILTLILLGGISRAQGQWTTSGNNVSTTNNAVNVGVGTSSPSDKLEVVGTKSAIVADTGQLIIRDSSSSVAADMGGQIAFGFKYNGANFANPAIITGAKENSTNANWSGYLAFSTAAHGTSNTEKMRITSSGNVGIGATTFDAWDASFKVLGLNTNNGFTIAAGNTSGNALHFTDRAYFNGTSWIYSASSTPVSNYYQGGGTHNFRVAAGGTAGSSFTWTNALAINNSGNVGIGTVNPGGKLQVGDGTGFITLRVVDSTGTIAVGSQGGFMRMQTDGTNILFLNSGDAYAPVKASVGKFEGTGVSYFTGNVGIGISNPTHKLDVNGTAHVTGNMTVDGNISAKYQDVAEWVPAIHALPAGTVVVLNPKESNQVMASSQAYDTRVAGVISERPGLALGEAGADKVLVATTGRVKVKVDATRAAICVGDLLVTSDVEGVAMKSEPLVIQGRPFHSPGTLIGKALEPLAKGTGEILVLLSLQ